MSFFPMLWLVASWTADLHAPHHDLPQTFTVTNTYDDNPFEYQLRPTASRPSYQILRITYPSPLVTPVKQNNTIPADYYLPDGINPNSKPRPAVICLHILNGNYELVRILCASLASRGIPAVMFKLPYYGERAMPGGERALARDITRFGEAMEQCFFDVRRTYDMLASRPEIDANRIGIAGISLGGIVSASAAGSEPRLERAALILAGGDLLTIIHHARETEELSQTLHGLTTSERAKVERAITSADPLTHAPGLRARALDGKVLMINASQDNVIPPSTTRKLSTALGITNQVQWYEGLGHYTAMAKLPEIIQQTVQFFAHDLPEDVEGTTSEKSSAQDPSIQIADLISQLGSMFSAPTETIKGKHIKLHVRVTDPENKVHQGHFHLARGAGNRFCLQWKAPYLGEAHVGQDQYPWMATSATLFQGKAPSTGSAGQSPPNLLTFANASYLFRVQLAIGAMTTLPLAPHILEQIVEMRYEQRPDGQRAILMTPRGRNHSADKMRVFFAEDGTTPQSVVFNLAGFQGVATIDTWQFQNVCDEQLFHPPVNLNVQQVDPDNIYRIFASLFNAAMKWTDGG